MSQRPPTQDANFSAQWIVIFATHMILQLLCLRLLSTSCTKFHPYFSNFLPFYMKNKEQIFQCFLFIQKYHLLVFLVKCTFKPFLVKIHCGFLDYYIKWVKRNKN